MPGALELSPEHLRALGYRVVDLLVEHMGSLRSSPVSRVAGRAELERRLREPPPESPTAVETVLEQLRRDVLGNIMHVDHPRFFAFVPGPGNLVGALADGLAAGFNVFAGTWLEASGPAQVELVTLDWLRQLAGLPEGTAGLFVSGGSVANLTALAVAREVRLEGRTPGAVLYASDQVHSSIERGLRVLGFDGAQLRKIPSDGAFRLAVPELRRAVGGDRTAGRRPFCVIATAGTTNTGAVDPLAELADFCRGEGLWLHADGAYGAAAVLCEEGRRLLEGLGRADSLSLDPHKWLFQPYEIGCVLVREGRHLEATFRILPEYLEDIDRGEEEVNFCDRGVQLTRGFRALKLWMSLKVFGLPAFREAVGRGFALARSAAGMLVALEGWEVVTPPQMAVVTFRYAPAGLGAAAVDALNRRLVDRVVAEGFAMLSSTVLRGRTVLRMCTINPRTTEEDLRQTVRHLDGLAREACRPS